VDTIAYLGYACHLTALGAVQTRSADAGMNRWPTVELNDDTLPGLFQGADQASLKGQRRYLAASRLRLGLVVLAAAVGAVSLRAGRSGIDVFAAVAGAALVTAAFAETWLLIDKPEQVWYDGRALAESAKTLAWRYSVGAAPFPKGGDESATARVLMDQLSMLLEDAPSTSVEPSMNPAISTAMRHLRAQDLGERRQAYITGRIEDQQRWYTYKSRWNDRRARLWRIGLIVVELAGVAAALLRAFNTISVDLAGIAAAMIAAGSAWLAIKDHDSLARAYAFAANELAIVHGRLESIDDEQAWAQEVADAEEAMSREHTMWRASRSSIRPRPPR
jgi:hypothetical protein